MKRFLAVLIVSSSLLASCATLPPAKQVQDLKEISGTWSGTVYTRARGNHSATLTIKNDGTWVAVAPTIPPGTFTGTARLAGGKVHWKSETSGRSGTWTLHEKDGQRVLVATADDGTSESHYTPKR
jgi:hypothetical protein